MATREAVPLLRSGITEINLKRESMAARRRVLPVCNFEAESRSDIKKLAYFK